MSQANSKSSDMRARRGPEGRDHVRTERSGVFAAVVATPLCAWLLWSAREEPLPALGLAAAFLFLATLLDVRSMRIPNWLTFPAFALALAHGAWVGGAGGALASLAGAIVAFGVLLVPYALRCLGAGDVKACMVLGALWGPGQLLAVFWWMLAIGGALGLAWLLTRGGLGDLARRWRDSLACTLATRRPVYFSPAPGSVAARGLPFAVCMTLGTAAYHTWGTPWL